MSHTQRDTTQGRRGHRARHCHHHSLIKRNNVRELVPPINHSGRQRFLRPHFFFLFFQPPGSLLLSVTSHKVDFSRSTYGQKKTNPHRVREKSVKKMYVGERDILEIFLHRKIKIKICLGKENHNDVISSTGRSIVTLREFRFFF